jgi:hypothetical protein
MTKLLLVIYCIVILISSIAIADSGSMKTHKDLKGKDGAKITCAYCHTAAKVPKKKGLDKSSFSKNQYCANKGCHQ